VPGFVAREDYSDTASSVSWVTTSSSQREWVVERLREVEEVVLEEEHI